ncbi:MAG: hypothetical protein OEX22_11585 [Cyclobacteriaceae bacterium]|nr:hypothetical protein [Cyclobacteriaceae bacterium]
MNRKIRIESIAVLCLILLGYILSYIIVRDQEFIIHVKKDDNGKSGHIVFAKTNDFKEVYISADLLKLYNNNADSILLDAQNRDSVRLTKLNRFYWSARQIERIYWQLMD